VSVRAAALALILALAACQQEPPASSAMAPGQPILSAEGFGPVSVGMTVAEAETALGGELYAGGNPEPESCEIYATEAEPGHGGVRYMAQQGRITRISDFGGGEPSVRTAQNVGVGSTDAEVRAAYQNVTEQPAKYDPPPAHDLIVDTPPHGGLRFEVNAAGIVTVVHAGDESIHLVEGCS
jgi:hypothetical protein